MNRICFVNGSPRGRNSGSGGFIKVIGGMLDKDRTGVHELCIVESVKSKSLQKEFEKLAGMDAIVFVFPLYIDAIPSSMLDFLYCFEEFINNLNSSKEQNKPPRVYAVINNGFVEGGQNVNAARIMRHYAAKIGFTWRFAIGIGAGEFIKETQNNIPLKSKIKRKIYDAIVKLVTDIESTEVAQEKDILASPSMPKSLFILMGNAHWTGAAKKSRKQLSARPF